MEQSKKIEQLSLMPTAWSKLPYMSDVNPLNEADIPCLREVRDVLAKYDALDRFAIALSHKHFELTDDEILVETIDFENRSLIVSTMNKSVSPQCVETAWSLGGEDALQRCAQNHCYSTCIEQEKAYKELISS